MIAEIWCDEHDITERFKADLLPDIGDKILLNDNSPFVKACNNGGMGFTVKKRIFWLNNKGYEDEVAIYVNIDPIKKKIKKKK